MEAKLDSLEMILKGIEGDLNVAESGLRLFKLTETFSMDGASNLESVRISLLNIRKFISIIYIIATKGTSGVETERYCNLAEFLKELIMEVKRVNPETIEKFDFVDESFEPGYCINIERMQILVYNIVRIFMIGSEAQKKKIKLKLIETEKEFRMEFRGDNSMPATMSELDECMFSVTKKVATTMGYKCLFNNTSSFTKCIVKIPKIATKQIALREDIGKIKLDETLAEIFFCDI